MNCSSNKNENDLPQVSMNVIATGDEKTDRKRIGRNSPYLFLAHGVMIFARKTL
jgi:hypothetical protein